MSQTVTIQLEKPIASATLLDQAAEEPSTASAEVNQAARLEVQEQSLGRVCQALQDAVNKLNDFREDIFKEHKEQIAKLSLEIARKILVHKIENQDYEIESIVQESLKNTAARQDVVVHLNPEDLAQCQKAQQAGPAGALADIKLVADPNIGRAECLIETPKGIVESLIAEHLERIGEALIKAK